MQGLVLRFEKSRAIRFIGHLDLHRALGRTFRRTGLPLAYSSGFNPQPQLVIARPLPVCAWGSNELLHARFEQPVSPLEVMKALGRAVPPGLSFLSAEPYEGKSPFADIDQEEYRLVFGTDDPPEPDELQQRAQALLAEGFAVERDHKGKRVNLVLGEYLVVFTAVGCGADGYNVSYTARLNMQRAIRPTEVIKLLQRLVPDAQLLEFERICLIASNRRNLV
jgi:radical SAM-linked protein